MKKRLFKLTAVLLGVITMIAGVIGSLRMENTFAEENGSSEGVTVVIREEYDRKNWQYNYYFDYTIPEDYDEDTIKIDLIGDLEKCYEEGIYEPGDGNNFYVNIVNLSGNEYVYSNGSMKITDGNYVDEKDADMAYTYDNTEAEYIKGAYTSLSNRPIAVKSTVWRTSNSALKELLDTTSNAAQYYSNESVTSALINAGYENGLDDLDGYYVDYMNKKYDKTCAELEDFSVIEICNAIFNGYTVNVREANKNVAALGYNMFYNNLLMLTLDDATVSNDDCVAGKFSLGSWMRDENSVDSYMNKKTGTLEAGMKEARNILNAHLHISGLYTTNPYQATSWGMEFTFTLDKVQPPTEEPTTQEPTTQQSTEQPTTMSSTSSIAQSSDAESSVTERVAEVAADEEVVRTGDSRKAVMYVSIIAAATLVSVIVIIADRKRKISEK